MNNIDVDSTCRVGRVAFGKWMRHVYLCEIYGTQSEGENINCKCQDERYRCRASSHVTICLAPEPLSP